MEPLAAILALLGPRTVSAKFIDGADRWAVRYSKVDDVGFGLVLKGQCNLRAEGMEPVRLSKGDFIVLPPSPGFVMESHDDVTPVNIASGSQDRINRLRHGTVEGDPDFRLLGGYFRLDPVNISLIGSLLPALVHIRESEATAARLLNTIELLTEEALSNRPGRDLIVGRLAEVLLVEALRMRSSDVAETARPGLLRGLADHKLVRALREFHADIARPWTVDGLAEAARLSRSRFSERFVEKIGIPPMMYIIQWRMAVAKRMLEHDDAPLETVAATIGYDSASAFSTAFRREVGQSPSQFAQSTRQRSAR